MLYLKIDFVNWANFWHADSDAITFYYTHTLLYILNFEVKAGGPMHLYSCTFFFVSSFWYPGIREFLDSRCKCWMLDFGCWTLDTGCWALNTGCCHCFRTESEPSFRFCLIKLLKILWVQISKDLMVTFVL